MNDKANKKIEQIKNFSSWANLSEDEQNFILSSIVDFHLTYQHSKQLIDMFLDFKNWNEPTDIFKVSYENRTMFLSSLKKKWDELKQVQSDYHHFEPDKRIVPQYKIKTADFQSKILGKCPVSSDKTRCCNLLTMDVVRNCGYDCNYCCIQSYFHDDEIIAEDRLLEKLKELKLDKTRYYHIGTGQSSDSLLWGNRFGHLEILATFLRENPNVILELKTKSGNVTDLLKQDMPSNIICTWSLNSDTIIKNEERFTASLNERLVAARKVADKKILVGFHFHPMIYYKGYEKEYQDIARKIMELFSSDEIAMISLGTLTYIKPVIKKIRSRACKSLVLQMPLEDIEGKFSYPRSIKLKLFKNLYDVFKDWHSLVYFYMCMEDKSLWKEVFNFEYASNADFEKDMIENYLEKIKRRASWDQ